jgi:hypothetical protein
MNLFLSANSLMSFNPDSGVRNAPSPEKFNGLASFVAGRSIRPRDHERDNGEAIIVFHGQLTI